MTNSVWHYLGRLFGRAIGRLLLAGCCGAFPMSAMSEMVGNELADIVSIAQHDSEYVRKQQIYALAARASAAESQRLIQESLTLPGDDVRLAMAQIFMERFANINPRAALDYCRHQLAQQQSYRAFLETIFLEWAWQDMKTALEQLTLLEPLAIRQQILLKLLRNERFNDNDKLQSLIAQLPHWALRIRASARSHQQAPRQVVMRHKDEARQNRDGSYQLRYALKEWTRQDPAAALEAVMGIESLTNVVLGELARSDGARMMELAILHKNRLSPRSIDWALGILDSSEIIAAAALIEAHDFHPSVVATMASRYAGHDPEAAFTWAKRMGLQGTAISRMYGSFAKNFPDLAEQQLTSMEPGRQRNNLISAIVQEKFAVDFEAAYEWLGQYRSEPVYKQTEKDLLLVWSMRKPARAATAILAMENEADTISQMSNLISHWSQQDTKAVERWVLALPPGASRARALEVLAEKVARQEPEKARALLAEITDEAQRREAEEKLPIRLQVLYGGSAL